MSLLREVVKAFTQGVVEGYRECHTHTWLISKWEPGFRITYQCSKCGAIEKPK